MQIVKKMEKKRSRIEFHPHTPNGNGKQTIKTAEYKAAQAESQEDSPFPVDGHRAILNKIRDVAGQRSSPESRIANKIKMCLTKKK